MGALESGKLEDFVTNKSSLPPTEKGSAIVGDEMRVADGPLKDSLVEASGREVPRGWTPDHAAATGTPTVVRPTLKGERLTCSQAAEKLEALKKDNAELRRSMNEMIGMLSEMLKA